MVGVSILFYINTHLHSCFSFCYCQVLYSRLPLLSKGLWKYRLLLVIVRRYKRFYKVAVLENDGLQLAFKEASDLGFIYIILSQTTKLSLVEPCKGKHVSFSIISCLSFLRMKVEHEDTGINSFIRRNEYSGILGNIM